MGEIHFHCRVFVSPKITGKLHKSNTMVSGSAFQALALSFPNTESIPHFERTGFKITGKRMFATYLEKDNTANIFLSPAEQRLFCEADARFIYPVNNKWGERGATTFQLSKLEEHIILEALLSAYNEILKKKVKIG